MARSHAKQTAAYLAEEQDGWDVPAGSVTCTRNAAYDVGHMNKCKDEMHKQTSSGVQIKRLVAKKRCLKTRIKGMQMAARACCSWRRVHKPGIVDDFKQFAVLQGRRDVTPNKGGEGGD